MTQSSYHADWQNRRIGFMIGLYGYEFFKNKKILELGAFNAYIGNYFAVNCGADVTAVEGRQENVDVIQRDYPAVKVICSDLDTPDWNFGDYDIIINYGLCYHLQYHHREHLVNCLNHCDMMFFESVIYDSFDPEISFNPETGGDQSLSGVGGTPSASFIENIFKEHGSNYRKYFDARLGYKYDWPDTNSKQHNGFYRRFWTVDVTGNNHSQLDSHFESTTGDTLSKYVYPDRVSPDVRLTENEWETVIESVSNNLHEVGPGNPLHQELEIILDKLYEYKDTGN